MRPRGHGQLYRRRFEAIAQLGDIVALRNADGFITDDSEHPFYVVQDVAGTPGYNRKAATTIWSHTAAGEAPYPNDQNCQAGVNIGPGSDINPGDTVDLQPAILQLQVRQLMQARFIYKAIKDNAAGVLTGAIDDYDLIVQVPNATPVWGTQAAPGVLNAMLQGFLPGDDVALPDQGSNVTAFSGPAPIDPADLAYRTERMLYGKTTNRVSIRNNGAAITAGGAIALMVPNFTFNLFPLHFDTLVDDWLLEYRVKRPAQLDLGDVIPLPVSGQTQPKSAG